MEIISRYTYIDHIFGFLNKGLMIALTGQRRVGKSFIMRELSDVISQRNPSANIIYINKEKKKFSDIKTDSDLNEYLADKLSEDKSNYLLIDEVQDIDGFENTLRSLNADEECQIIVTGSNAKMLSSELSTYLAGRYIEIHIQSLSYREFLKFHHLEDSPSSLNKYLSYGGLPHLYRLGLENRDMVWEYVRNLYNTIVLKDVIRREAIRNVTLFENLMSFVSDNTGQLISATSISKYLKSRQIQMTPLSAINYLRSASNAYIIDKVPRYDIHGKRLLETNEKFYFEDLGIRNFLVGENRTKDIEKVIENAVYLHLRNLGYKIYVGVLSDCEIDFVAVKDGRTAYFQVAYLIVDENTAKREFGNLQKIRDNYPKYVVTMDPNLNERDYDGITQMSLIQFLKTDKF